ncbi:beta strand repeat-containing protein, partial [Eionea flava]
MAVEGTVGKIESLAGDGKVLIVRSSGERVIAKPGDVVLAGDTVTTSPNARVVISVDSSSVSGAVQVSSGESAQFNDALFDNASNLISNSSLEQPVNVGFRSPSDIVKAFNEAFPDAGVETVVNLEEEFDPTSAGRQERDDRVVSNSRFNTLARTDEEEIPDDGTPTAFGEPLPSDPEKIPGAGDETSTNTTGGEFPSVLPDDGTPTDTDGDEDDEPSEEVRGEPETFIPSGSNTGAPNTDVPNTDTDEPTSAVADTNTVLEDTVLTVNAANGVLSNDSDSDSSLSVSTFTIAGDSTTYVAGTIVTLPGGEGTIRLNADGGYVYTPAANFNGNVPVVTYVTNTGASSTLTIDVTPVDDGPMITIPNDDSLGANSDDLLVAENATNTGSFTITTDTATPLTSLTIASGAPITIAALNAATVGAPISVAGTSFGDLNITDYNASTGVVTYTYDPTGTNQDHSGATNDSLEESLSLVLTDGSGATATATLDIGVTDTNPDALNDQRSIGEGTSAIAGNAVGVAGAATGDVQDTITDGPATVTDIDFGAADGTVGSNLSGDYGSLVISSAGVYTYTLDNANADVQGLKGGESFVETFTYTLTDNDGDSDTATIAVTINGVEDAPPTVLVADNNGASPGEQSVTEGDVTPQIGQVTTTASAGVSSLTITGSAGAVDITGATGATPVVITGSQGTLTVTDYNAGTGIITYSYVEDGNAESHNASNDNISDIFTINITDNEGDTASDTLTVTIDDTTPTAVNDSRTITEGADATSTTTLSGNVIDGVATGDEADTIFDANANPVTNIVGQTTSAVSAGSAGTVTGQYGSLTVNADGSYTYTLNNANTDVLALDDTESLSDTFTYTIIDGDGDTDTATLTMVVQGVNDAAPTVLVRDDNGASAGEQSVNEGDTTPQTGQITVTATAGVTSLTVTGSGGAIDITGATSGSPVVVAGSEGTLTITNYDAATGIITYSYVEDGNAESHNAANDNISDLFTINLTDGEGDTASDTLTITIDDTAPVAVADTRTVTEDDTGIAGNVITGTNASADTLGQDATTVTGVASGNSGAAEITTGVGGAGIAGTYGTLTIAADGSYTYVTNDTAQALANGASATDTFSYTIKDTDGDFSTTTFTLTVTGEPDVPTVTIPNDNSVGVNNDDITVVENATTSGSFTIAATDGGLASITVGGTTITAAALAAASVGSPIAVDGESFGDLAITGYDAVTGVVSYTYDPTGTNQNHSGIGVINDSLTDSVNLVVTDGAGQTDTATLDIAITDTAPTAAIDNASITEDASPSTVTGDVTTNDTQGADTSISVTGIEFDSTSQTVGSVFSTDYGTLDLNSDGTYTFTLDNGNTDVQDLDSGESLVETISYTIVDTDGDTSTSTLNITINGADEAPVVTIPDDNGPGVVGDYSVAENATTTGTFTVTSAAGLHASSTALSITVDTVTTNLTLAQLNNLSSANVTITDGNDGNLTLTNYNSSTGVIDFSFDPTGTSRDHSGGDLSVLENYSIVATDVDGNSNVAETLDILIIDTAPTAVADTRTVTEDDTGITGNVITGTNASADTLGADTTNVTGVAAGNSGATEITTGVGSSIAGTYGTLFIDLNGTYSYVTNDTAQALADGESATDTFSYTIKDIDGDFSTTTFTLTVTGEEDLPTVTIPNDNSVGLNNDDRVVVENTNIIGSFTITATDGGLESITVGTTVITAVALAAASSGSPISIDGELLGELEITGYNPALGVVAYRYNPTGTSQDHSSATNDSLTDSIGLVVTDGEGQTDTA